jgi:type VI protein secretion system component VasF
MLAMGMMPSPMSPEQLSAALADDRRHFERLVKQSGYVPETA